ncbi:thioredoxin [Spirochaetia bacterium]|nr:thioredoxin [Spirochaetia bacterium]
MGHPTVYPSGVTIYDKEAAWNGYTVFPSPKGAILIDMNGREVHVWEGIKGDPNKLLPGGFVMGHTGERDPQAHPFDNLDLVQADWNGNIVWKFDHNEFISDPGRAPRWAARQNHDYQREGSSTGYYAPGAKPRTDGGNTLILTVRERNDPAISGKTLLDSRIIEVNWEGKIIWEWNAGDHFEELGFDEAAKNAIYRLPSTELGNGGNGFYLAINSMSTLGPNRWYDGGDRRFHPDNIIWDARNANILAIISKETGKVVWRLGPDFSDTPFGWLIGQHHFHMIAPGLPGEGDFLVFDNGGWAGYGVPNGVSKYGTANQRRDYSRVLEFDPITLKVAWQYSPVEAGHIHPLDSYKLYSSFIGSAQRLPNGNTLITEGTNGRILEVGIDHKTLWEYINPYFKQSRSGLRENWIYRSYRVPYDWAPQLKKPEETSVAPRNVSRFRVPGAPLGPGGKVTSVAGVDPNREKLVEDPFVAAIEAANGPSNFCVLNSGE